MRPDMAKVVTESPRAGHGNKSCKTSLRLNPSQFEDDDHGPARHPISRYRQYKEHKTFTDLLGPLRRYLRKQVGRPWNNVFSDLSQHLDRRSLTGIHIWSHVTSEVQLKTIMVGKDVYAFPHYSGRYFKVTGLYVHPITQLLCYVPEPRYRYRKPVNLDIRPINGTQRYEKFKGLWFIVNTVTHYVSRLAKVNGVLVTVQDKVIEENKQQLGKKELKRHGLTNGS